MKYSFIIPVFNRPDEVDELLDSLTRQTITDFEVIIVEDGSQTPCESVCSKYVERLDLKYFMKENSGPGQSRNYGVERAKGEYVIILDSDVVVPEAYLAAVDAELLHAPCDAFGGPDQAHPSFTPIQKAISYSMTSFFTTGGIRGGKKKLDKFYPRSFNMGVRREVYHELGGFSKMRFGEDIDFSIRIFKAGCTCRLFPNAWVYHKRRTDFRKFWRQVFNSGIARINLYKKYPESLKLVHLLPMVFTLGVALCGLLVILGLLLTCLGINGMNSIQHGCANGPVYAMIAGVLALIIGLLPLLLYSLIVCTDASIRYRSLWIGILSVRAAFTQLLGYGCGFISAWYKRCLVGQDEYQAYEKNFYQ
jgi:GT2 family glycosyltransferase